MTYHAFSEFSRTTYNRRCAILPFTFLSFPVAVVRANGNEDYWYPVTVSLTYFSKHLLMQY